MHATTRFIFAILFIAIVCAFATAELLQRRSGMGGGKISMKKILSGNTSSGSPKAGSPKGGKAPSPKAGNSPKGGKKGGSSGGGGGGGKKGSK